MDVLRKGHHDSQALDTEPFCSRRVGQVVGKLKCCGLTAMQLRLSQGPLRSVRFMQRGKDLASSPGLHARV